MSVECEVRIEPFAKPNNISQTIQAMAPFQESPQPPQQDMDSDLNMQDIHQQGSRVSSPTSSTGSSSSRNPDTSNEYPIDLSSDDSSCVTNEYYSGQSRQHNLSNPLHELQNSLTRNGFLGQSLSNGLSSMDTGETNDPDSTNTGIDNLVCHICSFKAKSQDLLQEHTQKHYDFKCTFCGYGSRTEGRMNRHIQDFHSQVPPKSWAGRKKSSTGKSDELNTETSSSSTSKPKTTKCKQCDFTCDNKNAYYQHLRKAHLKKEKILDCPECCFVTDLKHHFEYHLRNHYGSKPFKCNKCNYNCVNKSMLNSHTKSHSKIFPYRCADCKYATKYCHSLKMHLRKYGHQPGQVLNSDGTPNQLPVIDVYGRRRGPKDKSGTKSKTKTSNSKNRQGPISNSDDRNSIHNQPFMYASPYFPTNPFPAMLMAPPSVDVQMSQFPLFPGKPFKCYYCEFVTDSRDLYQQHFVAHATSENSDLIRTCNINPDVFHVQAQHLTFNNYPQTAIHYAENSPKILSKDKVLTPSNHTSSSGSNSTKHIANASLSIAANSILSDTVSATANSVSAGPAAPSNVNTFSASALTNNTKFESANDFSQQNNLINAKVFGNSLSHSTSTQQDLRSERESLISNAPVFSPISKKTNDFEMSPNNVKMSNNQQVIPPRYAQKIYESLNTQYHELISYAKNDSHNEEQDLSTFSHRPIEVLPERSIAPNCSQSIENSPNINERNNNNYSPLDLSSAKSNSPTGKDCSTVQRSDASTSDSSPQSSDGFSSQSRNRRKGKAFKLVDYYVQGADSPIRLDTNGLFDTSKDINGTTHVRISSGSSLPDTRSFVQHPYNKEVDEIEMDESDNVSASFSNIKEIKRLENSSQNAHCNRSSGSPKHIENVQQFFGALRLVNQEDGYRSSPTVPKVEQETADSVAFTDSPDDRFICKYCDLNFGNCAMYTMHMGYHGYKDPYTCNKCGIVCNDKLDFFLHLMRISHT